MCCPKSICSITYLVFHLETADSGSQDVLKLTSTGSNLSGWRCVVVTLLSYLRNRIIVIPVQYLSTGKHNGSIEPTNLRACSTFYCRPKPLGSVRGQKTMHARTHAFAYIQYHTGSLVTEWGGKRPEEYASDAF